MVMVFGGDKTAVSARFLLGFSDHGTRTTSEVKPGLWLPVTSTSAIESVICEPYILDDR